MRENDYAFASGAIRAMENTLLPRSFFAALAQTDGDEMRRMLVDRGFAGFQDTLDPDLALRDRMEEVFEELLPYLPDKSVLAVCLLPNDFHNLKAALKSLIRGGERPDLYRRPASFDPAGLREILAAKRYDDLPEVLREAAREGYEILTQTGNGQQLDLELDRRCLDAMLAEADRWGGFIRRYAETFVLHTDFIIAYRLSRQQPGDALVRAALAAVPGLDLPALTEAVLQGEEAVVSLIKAWDDTLPDPEKEGFGAFEKALEDRRVDLLSSVRGIPCGPEVPVAYYLARELERKNICMLVSAAAAGKPTANRLERLRDSYA